MLFYFSSSVHSLLPNSLDCAFCIFCFSCIKSVHFPQGLFYSWKKKHIDLFWHTLPSAERIKSIQRRVCTDSHVYTQTHKHCNTWTLLFGSVLYTFSPSMFDQCCAAAFKHYLVNSKSEHSVQYKMYQSSFLLLTTNVFLAQIAWLEGWQWFLGLPVSGSVHHFGPVILLQPLQRQTLNLDHLSLGG